MTFFLRSRGSVSLLAYIALIVLVWVYLRSWWTLPSEVYVIQCKVEDFHSGLLTERQPVVVEDRVLRPSELCRVSLRHHYLYDRTWVAEPHKRWCTAAMVTLFRAHAPVVLRATTFAGGADVTFRLAKGELLMLPAHWHVVSDVACDVVEAFDISHTFFKPVRSLCDRWSTTAPPPPSSAATAPAGPQVGETEEEEERESE